MMTVSKAGDEGSKADSFEDMYDFSGVALDLQMMEATSAMAAGSSSSSTPSPDPVLGFQVIRGVRGQNGVKGPPEHLADDVGRGGPSNGMGLGFCNSNRSTLNSHLFFRKSSSSSSSLMAAPSTSSSLRRLMAMMGSEDDDEDEDEDDEEEWYPPSPPVYDVADKLVEINRDLYQDPTSTVHSAGKLRWKPDSYLVQIRWMDSDYNVFDEVVVPGGGGGGGGQHLRHGRQDQEPAAPGRSKATSSSLRGGSCRPQDSDPPEQSAPVSRVSELPDPEPPAPAVPLRLNGSTEDPGGQQDHPDFVKDRLSSSDLLPSRLLSIRPPDLKPQSGSSSSSPFIVAGGGGDPDDVADEEEIVVVDMSSYSVLDDVSSSSNSSSSRGKVGGQRSKATIDDDIRRSGGGQLSTSASPMSSDPPSPLFGQGSRETTEAGVAGVDAPQSDVLDGLVLLNGPQATLKTKILIRKSGDFQTVQGPVPQTASRRSTLFRETSALTLSSSDNSSSPPPHPPPPLPAKLLRRSLSSHGGFSSKVTTLVGSNGKLSSSTSSSSSMTSKGSWSESNNNINQNRNTDPEATNRRRASSLNRLDNSNRDVPKETNRQAGRGGTCGHGTTSSPYAPAAGSLAPASTRRGGPVPHGRHPQHRRHHHLDAGGPEGPGRQNGDRVPRSEVRKGGPLGSSGGDKRSFRNLPGSSNSSESSQTTVSTMSTTEDSSSSLSSNTTTALNNSFRSPSSGNKGAVVVKGLKGRSKVAVNTTTDHPAKSAPTTTTTTLFWGTKVGSGGGTCGPDLQPHQGADSSGGDAAFVQWKARKREEKRLRERMHFLESQMRGGHQLLN